MTHQEEIQVQIIAAIKGKAKKLKISTPREPIKAQTIVIVRGKGKK